MKKIALFVINIIVFCITSCSAVSRDECLVNDVIKAHESKQKTQRSLKLIGAGSSIPDDIKGFILHYISSQKVDIAGGRRLFVYCCEDLLNMINNKSELVPFLHNYPFVENNLELKIGFQASNGRFNDPPLVAYITLLDGNIHYCYYDNFRDKFYFDRSYKEPYEKALRIVREEAQNMGSVTPAEFERWGVE